MEKIDIINNVTKIFFINVYTYIVFTKLINYKENNNRKIVFILIISIIESILGTILIKRFPKIIITTMVYLFHSLAISQLTKNKLKFSIIVTFISFAITYLVYIISVALVAIILMLIEPDFPINSIYSLMLIICVEILLINRIFRIKRLKNGITFLKDNKKLNNIGIIGFAFIGITIIIYSIVSNTSEWQSGTYLFLGIVIESICMFIWIKQKIIKYYKQKLKEKTIEELENEIKEKDKEIKNILEENQRIATINHKYSNRIKALEGFSNKVMSKPEIVENMKVEFGDEFLNFEKQVQKLSKEYTMEMEKNIENKIPKTGIFGIDNILEYMNQEATKINIKFNVKINGNINYMIENIVEQSKLETMLGDHIKDAIIAINSSNNTNKNILLILGIIDEHYEVRIYDTGIEFEIPTLLKLGLEQITTHKETGGSGIGFMTTFETLKNTKASLIIEEKHPMNKTDYTKAVRIKFDGKNEYRIYTYRAEEIKKENKNGRIIITNA